MSRTKFRVILGMKEMVFLIAYNFIIQEIYHAGVD